MELLLMKNTKPNSVFIPRNEGFETTSIGGTEIFLNSARNRLVEVGNNLYQVVAGVWTGERISLSPYQQREKYLLEEKTYMPRRDGEEFTDVRDETGQLSLKDRLIYLPMEKVYLFVSGPRAGRKIKGEGNGGKFRIVPL